jgi:hypothetical protein
LIRRYGAIIESRFILVSPIELIYSGVQIPAGQSLRRMSFFARHIVCTAGFASRFRPWVRILFAVRKGYDDRCFYFFFALRSFPEFSG